MKLIPFLADLVRDSKLKMRFREDPRAMMEKAGLGEPLQEAILRGDRFALAAEAASEISTYDDFHMNTPWPGGDKPVFKDIKPARGAQGQSVLTVVRLYVKMNHDQAAPLDKSQPQLVEASLVRGKTIIKGDVIAPTEPSADYPYAYYHANFAIPAKATPGFYRVVTTVHWTKKPDVYKSDDKAFEVLAGS